MSPKGGLFYLEQLSLAASVSGLCERVRVLPKTYNVPLHVPGYDYGTLEGVKTIHYHRVLQEQRGREYLLTKLGETRGEWLKTMMGLSSH